MQTQKDSFDISGLLSGLYLTDNELVNLMSDLRELQENLIEFEDMYQSDYTAGYREATLQSGIELGQILEKYNLI